MTLFQSGNLSHQAVETLYGNGLDFSRDQIQELGESGRFALPEILYTWSIDDGNTATSNGDGIIQIRESADFHLIIKNASRYDLSDVQVVLDQKATSVDLSTEPLNIARFNSDATISMEAAIVVESGFRGTSLISRSLRIRVIHRGKTAPLARNTALAIRSSSPEIPSLHRVLCGSTAEKPLGDGDSQCTLPDDHAGLRTGPADSGAVFPVAVLAALE